MHPIRSFRLCLLLVFGAAVRFGQNSGIQGVVSDASGGVIPAANITVTNAATGVEFSAQCTETGFYSVPFLSPGTYSVSAETEGFATATRDNLKVDVQQIARVDFSLSVGAVTDSASRHSTSPTHRDSASQPAVCCGLPLARSIEPMSHAAFNSA